MCIGRAQGRILEVVGEAGECRVLYDDDMQERLTLPRERFRWLAPRARSAGATPALYVRGSLLIPPPGRMCQRGVQICGVCAFIPQVAGSVDLPCGL